jgi:hypothetical protein
MAFSCLPVPDAWTGNHLPRAQMSIFLMKYCKSASFVETSAKQYIVAL